jgi:hypothetical protein
MPQLLVARGVTSSTRCYAVFVVKRESFYSLIKFEVPLPQNMSTVGLLNHMITETVDAGIVTNRKHASTLKGSMKNSLRKRKVMKNVGEQTYDPPSIACALIKV